MRPLFELQTYEQKDKAEWDDFVRASKNGSFLFLRDYMEYHADRFRDASIVIRSKSSDEILALLPANLVEDTLYSHQGLTYGGLVVSHQMTASLMLDLFTAIVDHLRIQGLSKLIYKVVPKIYHLRPSEEDLFALYSYQAKLRSRLVISALPMANRQKYQSRRTRAVKKAQKAGISTFASTDLAGFWNLLTEVLAQRYEAVPVHSLEEMIWLQQCFPDNIKLFLAVREQRPLAGVLIYETQTVARAQYIASGEEGRDIGALDLLFDFIINKVYSNKQYFEFGSSNEQGGMILNRGLADYKEGFGASSIVLDTYEVQL
jgi:hypothetical protein